MKLELNGNYLVEDLQFSWNGYYGALLEIKVIKESDKAFLIKIKDGKEYWFFKKWSVNIVDKL